LAASARWRITRTANNTTVSRAATNDATKALFDLNQQTFIKNLSLARHHHGDTTPSSHVELECSRKDLSCTQGVHGGSHPGCISLARRVSRNEAPDVDYIVHAQELTMG
jgi:hypothetical protein